AAAVDADKMPAELLGGDQRCTDPAEKIQHNVARLGQRFDDESQLGRAFGTGMCLHREILEGCVGFNKGVSVREPNRFLLTRLNDPKVAKDSLVLSVRETKRPASMRAEPPMEMRAQWPTRRPCQGSARPKHTAGLLIKLTVVIPILIGASDG